jgi:hypothetical protein
MAIVDQSAARYGSSECESRARRIFEGQALHLASLAILLTGVLLSAGIESVRSGELWRIGSASWLWLAAASAAAHQIYVWACWRSQLHGAWITRTLGDAGFPVYAIGFTVLGIGRVVVVFLLAISNRGTLEADPTLMRALAVVALIPALYLFYSVKRYFGFKRAFGIDHFDPSYRSMPFVRKGIFRFTSNGMYVFGFLLIWVPGLWWASEAALVAALFNHVYIWLHYYATERPDMRRIYAAA